MASHARTTPHRVFLDASVIFAAAYSATGGSRELLIAASLADQRQLFLSDYVLAEARRNLAAKAPNALPVLDEILRRLAATLVPEPSRRLVLRVARNVVPKDAPVVAAAMRGRCDYIASLDRRDLVNKAETIRESFGISVVTPGEMLRIIRGEEPN